MREDDPRYRDHQAFSSLFIGKDVSTDRHERPSTPINNFQFPLHREGRFNNRPVRK
ncbi:MAG: hypothetical protein OJF50_001431 [Nitrospira sp.]|nr:hypothetical protein [Nitrospira sp.]